VTRRACGSSSKLKTAHSRSCHIYTDGACKGNPGPGGWAAILRYKHHKQELCGSERHTTNNRMELTAAVRGLAALKEACEVEIVTDSQYLKRGITEWLPKWKRNGWRTSEGKPVKNQDLWQELVRLAGRHNTHWSWTKGHASDEDNNRADELASLAASQQSCSDRARNQRQTGKT